MDRATCLHREAAAIRLGSASEAVNDASVKPFAMRASALALLLATVSIMVGCNAAPAESTEATENLPDEAALLALETESFAQSASSSGTEEGTSTTTVPDYCSSERSKKAFLVGDRLGAHWVRWMWRHFSCCDQVERFTDALMVLVEKLEQKAASKTSVPRCRLDGIVAGALEAVELLQMNCEADCFALGESVGDVAAMAYCDQALAADGHLSPSPWTRQPVGLCGFAYEMGCDAKFLGVAVEYVNAQGACEPYTKEPYAELWTLSRLKSCDYARRKSSTH